MRNSVLTRDGGTSARVELRFAAKKSYGNGAQIGRPPPSLFFYSSFSSCSNRVTIRAYFSIFQGGVTFCIFRKNSHYKPLSQNKISASTFVILCHGFLIFCWKPLQTRTIPWSHWEHLILSKSPFFSLLKNWSYWRFKILWCFKLT